MYFLNNSKFFCTRRSSVNLDIDMRVRPSEMIIPSMQQTNNMVSTIPSPTVLNLESIDIASPEHASNTIDSSSEIDSNLAKPCVIDFNNYIMKSLTDQPKLDYTQYLKDSNLDFHKSDVDVVKGKSHIF